MEKWKIGLIVLLLGGLTGYGVLQQNASNPTAVASQTPDATPKPLPYLGKSIGKELPEWGNLTQWVNTPKPITLASLKGHVALVEVFRTECSHCQEAAPFMEQVQARYQPRGLHIVSIQSPGDYKDPQNPENDWKKVQEWVKERDIAYPIAFDAKSEWFQDKMHGERYPTMLIFDPAGTVQFGQTGFDVQKAISLSVALEKALPGKGTVDAQAQDLADWLAPTVGSTGNPAMIKALADDLAMRLKGGK